MVIQTVEPISTSEATERMVKNIHRAYTKSELEQVVSNANYLNDEDRNQLLGLIKVFEYLFGVTIGKWDIEPVYHEFNLDSKSFNYKNYLVPRINKETFRKDIQRFVEIVVLTPVKQFQ